MSEIQGHLQNRWSKNRRFDLVWKRLGEIKPSQFLLTNQLPISECQYAYEELIFKKSNPKTLAVCFKY